jgi:hypothetical protein
MLLQMAAGRNAIPADGIDFSTEPGDFPGPCAVVV